MSEHREVVTIKEACAIARVSRRTLYTWIADKKVELVRTAGGNPRIYRDTLFRSARARAG